MQKRISPSCIPKISLKVITDLTLKIKTLYTNRMVGKCKYGAHDRMYQERTKKLGLGDRD